MTGPELAAALARIGWPSNELARRCDVSANLAWKAVHGLSPVPDPVAAWVQQIDRAVTRAPAPFWPRHGTPRPPAQPDPAA